MSSCRTPSNNVVRQLAYKKEVVRVFRPLLFFDYANTNSEPTTASGPNSKIPRFIGAFGN